MTNIKLFYIYEYIIFFLIKCGMCITRARQVYIIMNMHKESLKNEISRIVN